MSVSLVAMTESRRILHRIDAQTLKPGMSRAIEVKGTSILLCNVEGKLFALENRCSHAGVALDSGRLRGHRLECPLHSGVFDVRSGKALRPPARRAVRIFPIETNDEFAWIVLSEGGA